MFIRTRKFLNWRNLLLINILFMGIYSRILGQEITPEDLKLLNDFEFKQLRDFVRGKGRGSFSKVDFEDILSDNFQEPELIPEVPQIPNDPNGDEIVMLGGNFQMPSMKFFETNIIMPSSTHKPKKAPMPKKQQAKISTTERYKEEEHRNGPSQEDFEELARVLKLFRNKPQTPKPPPQPREKTHAQQQYKTANLIQPLPSTSFRRTTISKPLTHLPSPLPTPSPPPLSNPWPTYPKIRQESSPEFYKHKEEDRQKEHPQRQQQGLPIIIEQEEPDFASFVISPPAESENVESSWTGSIKPLAKSSAILPPSIREEDFKPIRPQKAEGVVGRGQGQFIKNINIRPRQERLPMISSTQVYKEEEHWENTEGNIEPFNNNNDWEEQMRELSRKLGSYLMSIKKKKEQKGLLDKTGYTVSAHNFDLVKSRILHHEAIYTTSSTTTTPTTTTTYTPPKAYVTVLREGYVQENPNDYDFIASITLIRDQGKVILVDTGLGTDINGRTDLIQKLQKLNIAPPMVDYVITTHGHPDHDGNNHEFPDSYHFQGNLIHYRTKFNFSSLYQNVPHQLTSNIFLIKTPGHTSDDITVIVHNTDKYGTIAISGDVFINVDDLDFPVTWQTLSWNETLQSNSRKEVLCQADYIIPGHGKIFSVTNNMRGRVNCR